jgi:hypothetical protein
VVALVVPQVTHVHVGSLTLACPAYSSPYAPMMNQIEYVATHPRAGMHHSRRAGIAQLESALQAAEAALDTDTRKFAQDVEQRVSRLKRDVLSLREVRSSAKPKPRCPRIVLHLLLWGSFARARVGIVCSSGG